METLNNERRLSHSITLQDRQHLILTGVVDVERFDENSVVTYTELGRLIIKGRNLNITRLDIGDTDGEVIIDGEIDLLEYNKGKALRKKESLISKLLG